MAVAKKTKLPPNPLVSEILDAVSKARSKTKKIEINMNILFLTINILKKLH